MRRRDCLRLLAVGLVTGLLPACFSTPAQVGRTAPGGPAAGGTAPAFGSISPYPVVLPPNSARSAVWAQEQRVDRKVQPSEPPLARAEPPPRSSGPVIPAEATPDEPPVTHAVASAPAADVGPPAPPHLLPVALTDEPALLQVMRCYIDGRSDQALSLMQGLDPMNQEVLLHVLPLVVRMGGAPLSKADPQQVAHDVDQLQSLMMTLRPRAALVVDRLCFCRQVRRFGMYESLGERPAFRSGELVEVYAEVRNVSCQPVSAVAGDFRTHLVSKVEIRDRNGKFGMGNDFTKIDLCHAPQHDYFQHYRFRVPDAPPGPYTLHLEVTDAPTGRKARRTLEFQIQDVSGP